MGLLVKEYVEDDVLLGIWQINETYQELLEGLVLTDEELKRLKGFRSQGRKLEFLSVRKLLQNLTNQHIEIVYNSSRKPFLKDGSYSITISHSNDYTAIMLSKRYKVGLDLEFMSHRISAISHKFINQHEIIVQNGEMTKYHLYIHWCAKEALYKLCDKKDINFKQNLTIYPFEPAERGVMQGRVNNRFIDEEFDLNYYKDGNYIIVWCKK